jgi:hypothetical protein
VPFGLSIGVQQLQRQGHDDGTHLLMDHGGRKNDRSFGNPLSEPEFHLLASDNFFSLSTAFGEFEFFSSIFPCISFFAIRPEAGASWLEGSSLGDSAVHEIWLYGCTVGLIGLGARYAWLQRGGINLHDGGDQCDAAND